MKLSLLTGKHALTCCRLSQGLSCVSVPNLPRVLLSSQSSFSRSLSYPRSHLTTNVALNYPRRTLTTTSSYNMPVELYSAEERGQENTDTLKVFVKDSTGPISPFHDIPLVANSEANTFHIVVEIPRWTNAKMEIDTKSPLHPIVQDQKKGKLRYVANSFPHHGYIWNYGCFPQTWENPNHKDESTQANGDNDPVDCCEIGHRVAKRGDVLEVKVLGTLAMIDDGEADWKMIVIDVTDPLAAELNNLEDVEKAMPGFLAATRDWFRIYKIPDGKPENNFAFDGEYQDAEFAGKILNETNLYWKQLVGLDEVVEDPGKLSIGNVLVEGSKENISREEASSILSETAEFSSGPEQETSVDTWHYGHLKQ
eukprot:GFUD01009485.1.p1 GENE.GFUD01009485.1~~GFUD01009485.1.p1  ORF type:complete len:367 (-),score=120.82 GFUD01009485.1:305-1405(-)